MLFLCGLCYGNESEPEVALPVESSTEIQQEPVDTNIDTNIDTNNGYIFIKSGDAATNLDLSPDNSLVMYSEDDLTFIRDFATGKILYVFPFDRPHSLAFSTEGDQGRMLAMLISSLGELHLWDIATDGSIEAKERVSSLPISTLMLDAKKSDNDVSAASFSHSSNLFAVALKDGSIGIMLRLRYTNEITPPILLKGHEGAVQYLTFCLDSKHLASSGADGTIRVWDMTTYKEIVSYKTNSTIARPMAFSNDERYLAHTSGGSTVLITDFTGTNHDGEVTVEFSASGEIWGLKSLVKGNKLSVLVEGNKLEIYSMDDGSLTGWIPPYNQTRLVEWVFSSDNEWVLLGYDDGSVYKVPLEQALLEPGEEAPSIRNIPPEFLLVRGGMHTDRINPDGSLVEIRYVSDWLGDGIDTLHVEGKVKLLNPYPYSMGFEGGVSWHIGSLLNPLYFGVGMDFGYAMWRANFPYVYTVGNKTHDPPGLYNLSFYIPFGISFRITEDIILTMETKFGVRLLSLMNLSIPHMIKPFPAFATGLTVRCSLLNWNVAISVDYDGIQGFIPALQVGYRFRLPSLGSGKTLLRSEKYE